MGKPRQIKVGREVYHAIVLKVVGKDPDGSVRTLELLRDDESTDVEEGMQFFIVYGTEALRRRLH